MNQYLAMQIGDFQAAVDLFDGPSGRNRHSDEGSGALDAASK